MRAALADIEADRRVTVVVVTNTEGGAVRSRGAMMAVREDHSSYGYISGGCIDADVILQAAVALKDNQNKTIRYGKGSPFLDIRLPCGGAIDLMLLPNPDTEILKTAIKKLDARKALHLSITQDGLQIVDASPKRQNAFTIRPKLSLRIAGRGTEPLAMANLASACGLKSNIWSPDSESLRQAETIKGTTSTLLSTPSLVPQQYDDHETAFVLMFHDSEWETPLLESALFGDAFYIGAVGSRSTHMRRCEHLRERGVSEAAINRIRGPIGLVPSMRDASMLAVSTLAEIIGEYHKGAE